MNRIYYQTFIDITWQKCHCVPFDVFSPLPSNLFICLSQSHAHKQVCPCVSFPLGFVVHCSSQALQNRVWIYGKQKNTNYNPYKHFSNSMMIF